MNARHVFLAVIVSGIIFSGVYIILLMPGTREVISSRLRQTNYVITREVERHHELLTVRKGGKTVKDKNRIRFTAVAKKASGGSKKKQVKKAIVERKPLTLSWQVNTSNRRSDEVHHVVFVKVHKAASTTVYNMLVRFAMSRDLNIMLPNNGHVLSQDSSSLQRLLTHPPSPPFKFDILCNHYVFNHDQIRRYFPPDTKYVAIVREPWQRLQSAFWYYKHMFNTHYLRKANTFANFVQNRSLYEPKNPLQSQTFNRMSLDLGLSPAQAKNPKVLEAFVQKLDKIFDLVLIADRFDESVVLMKRLFRWTSKDIMYKHLNTLKDNTKKTTKPDPALAESFGRSEQFDVAVYEHFSQIFDQKVIDQGPDFEEELRVFRETRNNVSHFCDDRNSSVSILEIPATVWDLGFVFRREECQVVDVSELIMNDWAREKQLARLSGSDKEGKGKVGGGG